MVPPNHALTPSAAYGPLEKILWAPLRTTRVLPSNAGCARLQLIRHTSIWLLKRSTRRHLEDKFGWIGFDA